MTEDLNSARTTHSGRWRWLFQQLFNSIDSILESSRYSLCWHKPFSVVFIWPQRVLRDPRTTISSGLH